MRIYLISVARRVPPWVRAAYEDYAVRLPARCALGLIEVTAERRWPGQDTQRPLEREGERVLKAIPPSAWVVALDEHGERWGTADLARRLADWQRLGRDVALLVGGADGLESALSRARRPVLVALAADPAPCARARHPGRADLPRAEPPRRPSLSPWISRPWISRPWLSASPGERMTCLASLSLPGLSLGTPQNAPQGHRPTLAGASANGSCCKTPPNFLHSPVLLSVGLLSFARPTGT